MKILFVAVFNPQSTNFGQANALEKLGHTVIRYEYRDRSLQLGNGNRDTELKNICKSLTPDLVIFSKCPGINTNVIKYCNKHSKTCMWYMDTLVSWDKEVIQKIEESNFTVCAWEGPYKEAKKYSSKVFILDEGFDSDVDKPIKAKKRFDITFIGSPNKKRDDYINIVNGIYLCGMYGAAHARAVAKSKINVNFTRSGGASDRVYKVLAANGFLLTEAWPGMEISFTPEKDFIVFNGVKDFKTKVNYYLAHKLERDSIAKQGFTSVQKFSRDSWAKQLIEIYNNV